MRWPINEALGGLTGSIEGFLCEGGGNRRGKNAPHGGGDGKGLEVWMEKAAHRRDVPPYTILYQ